MKASLRRSYARLAPVLFFTASLGFGCYSGGEELEGWSETPAGDGPTISWDLDARPLPEIPYPNDMATRPDASTATGRRVNAPLDAPTQFERDLRRQLNELDGFGTFAPIWLSFAHRLDLQNIADRQKNDLDFTDDVLLVIDVTPGSPTYGEPQAFDFGQGNYPVTVRKPDAYFRGDSRSQASNLVFDVYDERGQLEIIGRDDQILPSQGDGDDHCDRWEDANQNGILDEGEDLDGDGHLDVHEDTDNDGVCDIPNVWGAVTGDPNRMHSYNDLISFYELETNSLTFRPIVPLREQTTYAVVVTNRLVDEAGAPVRSPFPYIHHLQQKEALRPLFEGGLLAAPAVDLETEDVAFAWTFTTQTVTDGLLKLREGIYGYGPLGWLAEAYPAEVTKVVPVVEGDGPENIRLKPSQFVSLLKLLFEEFDIGGNTYTGSRVDSLLDTYGAVDYISVGEFTSADFVDSGGGSFKINFETGDATHAPIPIRFMVVVPKEQFGPKPFPVAMYAHGHTSMIIEALAFGGAMAKMGVATIVIDAYGHGLPLGPEFDALIATVIDEFEVGGIIPFYDAIKAGRAKDLNNDGVVEPGGDFWTNDTFHTRDVVRQTVFDYFQLTRVLRSFDGRPWQIDVNGDGIANDLAGDFDGDGVVDFGGPDNDYYALGTSMGGILSSIMAAVEPAVVAAAPMSPGGGLLEIGVRTDLGNAIKSALIPMLGPMVLLEPNGGNEQLTNVSWLVNNVFSEVKHTFARVGINTGDGVEDALKPGDVMRVENLTNGEVDEVVVPPSRVVRAHLPSDRGDRVRLRFYRPDGTLPTPEGSYVRPDATLLKEIDTFEYEIAAFHGRKYEVDQPLETILGGMGHKRNTPGLRRLLGLAQMILEPGDPVNYGHLYDQPIALRPDPAREKAALFVLTLGDMTVPLSAGAALARASGILDYRNISSDYGVSHNQLLIDTKVIEAIDELRYFRDDCCRSHCEMVNFDIDDLSNGRHDASLPRLSEVYAPLDCGSGPAICTGVTCEPMPPLRITNREGDRISGIRFPALDPRGQHALDLPDPTQPFDASMFMLNQIALYLSSGGKVLSDHPCLSKNDCSGCSGEAGCPALPPPTSQADLE